MRRRHRWLALALLPLIWPLALYWSARRKAACEAWRRTRNRPRRWSEKLERETATAWDSDWQRGDRAA